MSDPTKIHSDLKNILSRREFQAGGSGTTNQLTDAVKWVQKQWETFVDWIKKAFSFASNFGTLGKVFVYSVVALLLVGAAIVLARVLQEYFRNRALASGAERTVFDEDDPEDDISHDVSVWLQDGSDRAGVGDYRRAYRAVFVALLMQFETAGIVKFERGTTNGEYYRSVRDKTPKAVADTFREFVIGFDVRWYGRQETTEADYNQARTFYDTIQNALTPEPVKIGTEPKSLAAEGA